MNTCTAESFYDFKHGKDTQFLSKQAIIDFAEQYAQKFWAHQVNQVFTINDTYSEQRKNYPKPPIQDLP